MASFIKWFKIYWKSFLLGCLFIGIGNALNEAAGLSWLQFFEITGSFLLAGSGLYLIISSMVD